MMSDEGDDIGLAWVDHDHPPMPRNYEQCGTCGQDRVLRHQCDLEDRLAAMEQAVARVREVHVNARPGCGERCCAHCAECGSIGDGYPCPTIRALDGTEEAP